MNTDRLPVAVRGGQIFTGGRYDRRRHVGQVAAAAAVAGCLLIQQLSGDWFPPAISVSQYGVGRWGVLFTCWTVLLGLAPVVLHSATPPIAGTRRREAAAKVLLSVGGVAAVVMGLIRTDAGGLQHSWHAKVHLVASIFTLVALPFGIALSMQAASRFWRAIADLLALTSTIGLIGVLMAAGGAALPGMDAASAWAFWQAVAVGVDLALLVGFAASAGSIARDRRMSEQGRNGALTGG